MQVFVPRWIGNLLRIETAAFVGDGDLDARVVNAIFDNDLLVGIPTVAVSDGVAQCLVQGQANGESRVLIEPGL